MENEMILLILSGIFYGAVVPGGMFLSNLGLSSYEIAVTTTLVPSVLFFILSMFKGGILKRKDVKLFVLLGLVNALLLIVWTSSISFGTPISIVTLLLYTQPIWTLIFGKMFFKEEITKRKIISLAIIISGILILVSPWNVKGNISPIGLILGFLSGLLYSLFLIISKETANRKIHYTTSIFGFSIFTVILLLIIFPLYRSVVKNDILSRLDMSVIVKNSLKVIIVSIIMRLMPQILLYKSR